MEHTEILPHPDDIHSFHCTKKEKQSNWTKYEQNPSYATLISKATLVQKIQALVIFTQYALNVFVKKLISYQHIPTHLRKPKSVILCCGFIKTAGFNMMRKLRFKSFFAVDESSHTLHQALKIHGVVVLKAPQSVVAKVDALAAPLLNELRQVRSQKSAENRAFSDSRTVALRTTHQALFQTIETLFADNGVLDAVSKYLGRRAKVIDINPQLNDNTDNFWQKTFPDLNIALPATAYYHRDASGGDVKVIIYLSYVRADNGPFAYVLGSQQSRPNSLINFVQEVNDTSGLSGTELTYRQWFSALPKFLRSKCAFGNDIINSEVADRILKSTWNITASKGHMIVFDSKGLHRGGMVLDKERVVITCVLA